MPYKRVYFELFQRARDEQARKEKVAATRQRLSDRSSREGDVISELEQRLMIANGHTPARGKKNQKSKLDSSQINDGDFEKIMNGRFEYPYSMLSFCFVDTVEYRYVIKVVYFRQKAIYLFIVLYFSLQKLLVSRNFLKISMVTGKQRN